MTGLTWPLMLQMQTSDVHTYDKLLNVLGIAKINTTESETRKWTGERDETRRYGNLTKLAESKGR